MCERRRGESEKATCVKTEKRTLVADGDDEAAEDGGVDSIVDVELLAVLGKALERSLERLEVCCLQLLLNRERKRERV